LRAEEVDVDVDGWDGETIAVEQQLKASVKGWEEDIRWAAECPDEDIPNWTMRIVMHKDD
jgi:hypothetical protein